MSELPPNPVDIAPPSDAGVTEPAGPRLGRGRPRAALGFIFVTALMDIVAIGIIIPVLPRLIQGFAGGDAAAAARYVGVFGAAWALMQFIFTPIQGGLSDHFGRRPVLLASIFGLGLDYVLMALAPNLAWLFVGRLISGMTAASFSTANAYISDITPPERRAQSFGLMGAAFGLGFALGPAAGGLLGQISPRAPFWAAAALALINGLYGLFILPESLPKANRSPFSLAKASPLGSFRLLAADPELLALGAVSLLYYLAQQSLQSSMVLYTIYRYAWPAGTMGLMLAAIGVANIVVQGGLIRPFVERFKERGALYVGLVFASLGMLVWGWAPIGLLFWGGVPLFALSGLVQPGVQGMMTRRVPANAQGRLQGANSGLMAMAGLVGPILFTQIFAASISGPRSTAHPGLAFYLAAALLALALMVAVFVRRASRPGDEAGRAEPAGT